MGKLKNLFGTIFTSKNTNACFAPFQSMRFNHSGNVLACCFNRGNILGKFPEQSLEEIWFGSNVKKLQNAISKNDFSLGCQSCEKYITCGNREISGASQYDYLKLQKQYKKYPTMLDFELGSTCNFECIMCSGEYSTAIRANREKKSPYYSPYENNVELFVSQLIAFIPHLQEMRFIGGEPFLMKVYYGIWDKVIELNPNITLNVLTNGSILSKRVQTLLEKGNFKISVSIDSLVKKTYEEIRINGDFDKVMSNVSFFHKLMQERGHIMNFNLCVMRQNWQEIPDYFNYCNQNNIKVILHTVEFPVHCSLWNLPEEELKKIDDLYLSSTIFDTSTFVSEDNKITFEGLKKQISSWYLKAMSTKKQDNKNLEELKELFLNKIKENDSELVIDSDFYYNFIIKTTELFSTKEQIKLLKFLNQIDTHLILDEVNVSSEERIIERFKVVLNNRH